MEKIVKKKIGIYLILAAVLLIYFVVRVQSFEFAFYRGLAAPADLAQDYIGARQLLAGKSVYPADFTEIYKDLFRESPRLSDINLVVNAHPPFVSMLLFPLGFLSFENAAVIYTLITIACMFFTIFLLLKSEDISLIYFPFIALFTLAWQPFQSNLMWGQISVLVTLFVTIGWFFSKKRHETMSGVFIALATMLKFYPGLLIVYFLINKRWKAFLVSITTAGAILLLALIVTRYDLFHFISNIMPQDIKNSQANLANLSINGFFSKLFLPTIGNYFTLFVSPFLNDLLFYAAVVLLLLYSALHIKEYNNDLGFSLFIILSLLLSPLCWDHSLTLLLLSFAILIKELVKRNNRSEIIIFLVSLFLISIDVYSIYFQQAVYMTNRHVLGNSMGFIDTLTFYSLQFYGMLLLLFLNFRMIKKEAPQLY